MTTARNTHRLTPMVSCRRSVVLGRRQSPSLGGGSGDSPTSRLTVSCAGAAVDAFFDCLQAFLRRTVMADVPRLTETTASPRRVPNDNRFCIVHV
ncbi:hypothetical protein RB7729 [Rhodopirellula baltica SH 1]|uniref:Uncharacterized protein n=1 Tax=Rhodopirellula baltica (strain DSM 10527 / NCIMB 13988 / SH1) TaxID=243090 RepID=Q7UN83_RHOBA|nr:hypothetical protein RB7729 [Rhodopirellula baltica SH 1]